MKVIKLIAKSDYDCDFEPITKEIGLKELQNLEESQSISVSYNGNVHRDTIYLDKLEMYKEITPFVRIYKRTTITDGENFTEIKTIRYYIVQFNFFFSNYEIIEINKFNIEGIIETLKELKF